jgi:hypothetical protein
VFSRYILVIAPRSVIRRIVPSQGLGLGNILIWYSSVFEAYRSRGYVRGRAQEILTIFFLSF